MAELRRISIPRSARYALFGDPGAGPREGWFVLHGYGQLAPEFLGEFEDLRAHGRVVVAPEALSRFYLAGGGGTIGGSWMTSLERESEIDDYLRYLDAVYGEVHDSLAPAARVSVLGFSQGAATAARWAALGLARIDRLVLWAGGVPPDLDLAAHRDRLAAAQLTLVYGERDRSYDERQVEQDAARLRAAGLVHRVASFTGGHRLDRELLRRLVAEAARA